MTIKVYYTDKQVADQGKQGFNASVLTTEQIAERDNLMFSIAKRLNIPIAWDLAGGYQVDKDGRIDEVIKIHLNTFQECQKVFGA